MSLVEIDNISKSYLDGDRERRTVLEGLSLSVGKGEFVAVTGPSGCGKTTLLNIIGTLLMPDSGRYVLDGETITGGKADLPELRRLKIGFLFQDHRLIPQYTVLQNVLLPVLARQDGTTPGQEARAMDLLERTGIAHLSGAPASTLSGGEASRAALCRALVMEPLLLLADEPTGQLDEGNGRKIVELMGGLRQQGTAIVMVTHSASTAAAADRILTIRNRTLVED